VSVGVMLIAKTLQRTLCDESGNIAIAIQTANWSSQRLVCIGMYQYSFWVTIYMSLSAAVHL